MRDSNVHRRIDAVVRLLTAIAAVIAITSMIGWIIGSKPLLTGLRSTIPIRFNTALCLLVAAIAVWLVRQSQPSARRLAWARVCSAAICVVAGLTMSQDVFGWDLGIDQLLCKDTFDTTRPGRMSFIAASGIIFLGVFIGLVRSRRPIFVHAAQTAALLAAIVGQWSVLDVLLRQDEGTGIAFNAAFSLLSLSLAMLLVPNDKGLFTALTKATAAGQILRRLVPTAVLAPTVLGWIRWRLTGAGALDTESGIVLLVTACTMALLVVAIWTAKTSDAIDSERQRVTNELQAFFELPLHSLLSIIGFDGRFRTVSTSWTRILGYSEEEILSTPYLDLVHPDDREKTSETAAFIAAGNPAVGFENRYRTKNGAYRWLTWNAIPAANQVMYAIAEDITERKQIEEQLRENSERLRLLIDGAKEHALYLLDPAGNIVSWNVGAARLTGYTAQEILGRPMSMLYPGEVPATAMEEEIKYAAEHGSSNASGWRARKDGSRFFIEGYITRLNDEQGRLRGFAKIVRDVTERIAAEQQIRELNEQLEERVKQRTAELAASNRELEAFAYSVSHDLRAPLRHLDGFLALLRRRAYAQLDDSAKHYIDATMDASRRMGTLIDELLQFSRLGRANLHRDEVHLRDVITDVRRELQPDVAKRVVRWNIDELPAVVADRGMVRQVMQNLIANALKFTRPRPEVVITISGEVDEQGDAVITVADNGVGFDMQYYNKLFGVFQRLHTEDEFEGTGIGLANVRRIVERHGGRVWAESIVGQGATFHFTLPVSRTTTGEQHDRIEAYSAG